MERHVGAARIWGRWRKCCADCLALFIGSSLQQGFSNSQIAESVNFRCGKHDGQKEEECIVCFSLVEELVRKNWRRCAPGKVLALLAESVRNSEDLSYCYKDYQPPRQRDRRSRTAKKRHQRIPLHIVRR
jgi:hypothetical protein